MEGIKHYKILTDTDIAKLTQDVKAHIEKKWIPMGGVAVDNSTFYQALVMVVK